MMLSIPTLQTARLTLCAPREDDFAVLALKSGARVALETTMRDHPVHICRHPAPETAS